MTSAESPIYEPGDVVFGADPYKGNERARPWLVISNHEGRPFHGDQYIVLTLTTKSWLDGLMEIDQEEWLKGGTSTESRIVPWAIQFIDHNEIDYWQGAIAQQLVEEAVDRFVDYLRA